MICRQPRYHPSFNWDSEMIIDKELGETQNNNLGVPRNET